jgi:glyoxylase-like metal-dependent hydrolase (beta-lactamase superfamily II)
VRALALHADVIVFISQVWQTTATAVRSGSGQGNEGFLIDSPVYPDELEALPGVLEQAGFPVSGLLVTHADWDHLLGRLAFPEASLGCGETSARRLRAEPGAAQRDLRRFDDEHYVQRPRPLALAAVQELPVPGRVSLGADNELQLHEATGHTGDGMAVWIPWAGILVCGDYLSPVEIPMISENGSADAYLRTLAGLRQMVDRAERVVPGHGAPLTSAPARRLLDEDEAYVKALLRDPHAARLPRRRDGARQKQIHAENVGRLVA